MELADRPVDLGPIEARNTKDLRLLDQDRPIMGGWAAQDRNLLLGEVKRLRAELAEAERVAQVRLDRLMQLTEPMAASLRAP